MSIFISLSAGLTYAIIRGVRAHNFETSYREATLQTRNALSQMVEELRTATVPEDLQTMANNEFSIPSAVWFPDAYGSSSTGSLAGYKLGTYNKKINGKEVPVYRGYNRLIFTRLNPNYKSGDSTDTKYVFVDWFVSKSNPNRLYRIVRKIQRNPLPYYVNTDKQYAFVHPDTYLGNGSQSFGNMAFLTGKHADYIVVQLPGPQDVICFAVEHAANEDIFGKGSFGTLDQNQAVYDPNLFNIIVKSTVYERSFEDKRDVNTICDPNSNPDSNAYADPADPSMDTDYSSPDKRAIVYIEQAYISH